MKRRVHKIEVNEKYGTRVVLPVGYNPQDLAMIQALYSRSSLSVIEQLKKLDEVENSREEDLAHLIVASKANSPEEAVAMLAFFKEYQKVYEEVGFKSRSGDFMEKYYVGYGHPSIGDCGTATLFFEGISMLAAKAIEDWPLFSGQECSTRYINMKGRPVVDPLTRPDVIDELMLFYENMQEPLAAHIREQHPIQEGEDPVVYERTVKARVFDISRSIIPAGMTTQISWTSNFRQFADAIAWGVDHPLEEIRLVFRAALELLQTQYPQSFSHKYSEAVLDWRRSYAFNRFYNYVDFNHDLTNTGTSEIYVNHSLLAENIEMLGSRPRGAKLPHFLDSAISMSAEFLLDYGSFRDIQRHRRNLPLMPLLTEAYGFHTWYHEQLPDSLKADLTALMQVHGEDYEDLLDDYGQEDPRLQYYVPMGYRVPTSVNYPLPALIYTFELRSPKTVHPTLRIPIHHMIRTFQEAVPEVALHVDLSPDDWTLRRGTQTIVEKKLRFT